MILTSLAAILERSAKPESGGFINTKLSLFSGDDFPANDPIRGLSTIYSWIQGRGLESLAVHYLWLQCEQSIPAETRKNISRACLKQLEITLESMEKLRDANSGRLLFMHDAGSSMPLQIDAEGNVFETRFDPTGPSTMSELFYVKGLAAAADVLGDAKRMKAACRWYEVIHNDIITNRFINDQLPLDPKNIAAKPVQGRLSHGPRIIAIGAAFRFLEITGDKKYLDYGLKYIDYILANHVNLGHANSPAKKFDMWEFTDENLKPYYDATDRLMSDPGHATEFTGLTGKLIVIANQKYPANQIARLAKYKNILPAILEKNFNNGFSDKDYGICKTVDLISKKPTNSDMPWWPLPETIRAACLAIKYNNNTSTQNSCRDIFTKCSNAFRQYFIRQDLHMMAYQTLSANGKPIDVIPATPDADPGYHTNLSIIDCFI